MLKSRTMEARNGNIYIGEMLRCSDAFEAGKHTMPRQKASLNTHTEQTNTFIFGRGVASGVASSLPERAKLRCDIVV